MAEINAPAPCGLEFVFALWGEMSWTREAGFASAQPLTYREFEAFKAMRPDWIISGWVASLVMQIDRVFRRLISEKQKDGTDG